LPENSIVRYHPEIVVKNREKSAFFTARGKQLSACLRRHRSVIVVLLEAFTGCAVCFNPVW